MKLSERFFFHLFCTYFLSSFARAEPSQRLSIRQLREAPFLAGQLFPLSLPKYKLSQGIKDANERSPTSPQDAQPVTVAARELQVDDDEESSEKLAANTTSSEECSKKDIKSNATALSNDELEAYRQLSSLGISDAMINESREKGVRSNVIGTYRIVLHRIVSHRYAKAARRAERGGSGSSTSANSRTTRFEMSNGHAAAVNGVNGHSDRSAEGNGSHDGQDISSALKEQNAADNNDDVTARPVMKSTTSKQSHKSMPVPYNINNNSATPVCAATLYCGVMPPDEDDLGVDCCPCRPSRPLSNNFFPADSYAHEKRKKKRWKAKKKFFNDCTLL